MFELRNVSGLRWRGWTPPSERRIHNRARAIWQSLRREQTFPRMEDFDVAEMSEIFEHGFLLKLRPKEAPLVTHAGDILREEAELEAVPVSLAVIAKRSLLGQFGSRWEQVISAREPMTSEYEFMTEAGYKVSCRGILLPLATDGETIDHVFGVVNWKSKKLRDGSTASTLDPAG